MGNIRTVERAFGILALLSDGKPRTLTDVSQAMEISTSTIYRFLNTLANLNYVERDPLTGEYHLGLACLELARAYQKHNDVRRLALPSLEKLRDETKETVHLGVLNNMEVVYLEKMQGLHAIGLMASRAGGRAPAYCTGLGKVMLAYHDEEEVRHYFEQNGLQRFTDATISDVDDLLSELGEIRAKGYGFDRGEHENEVRCIAAPIFDKSGDLVASISVSGPFSRMDPVEENRELIQKVTSVTSRISRLLGYQPTAPDGVGETV